MSRLRRLAALVFAALALGATPAGAQVADPEKAAAIRELIEILNVRNLMGAVASNAAQGMLPMAERLVEGDKRLTPQQKASALADMRARAPRMQAEMQRSFSDPKFADGMERMVARVYDKVFTTEEIRDITAFYRSPTGRKMQQSMPLIMQESMKASAELVAPLVQEMAERLARESSGGK